MWGAIIGDLAGSTYEYSQHQKTTPIVVDELITEDSFFTDDTILTIAIYNAIRGNRDYENSLKEYGIRYLNYVPETSCGERFHSVFGGRFEKWLKGEADDKSIGNGAMMRISGIGKMFITEEEVVKNAMLATIPSHNTLEAIDCARTVALVIFYARMGYKKEEIKKAIGIESVEYKPFESFNKTCYETLNNCLYAFFESVNFEDALRKVLSYGGDTDTNGAIVGAMAEAFYGIPEHLITKARKKLPIYLAYVLDEAYTRKNRSMPS